MSPRPPLCATTAAPGDTGTLNRGRTASPAERYKHSGHGRRKQDPFGVVHRLKLIQKEVADLHAKHGETIEEIGITLTPGVFDIEEMLSKLTLTRRLEPALEKLGEECAKSVKATLAMFARAQELHMSPIRLVDENYGVLVARCTRLIRFFEGLEEFFKYAGPLIVLIDLIKHVIALLDAIHDKDLHDGGRTIAFHITSILILTFVSVTAVVALICAAFDISVGVLIGIAELESFGAILGVAALPFMLICKPPEGYRGPASQLLFEERQNQGRTNSKEYMEAVDRFLKNPSPINLINLNAIKHAM